MKTKNSRLVGLIIVVILITLIPAGSTMAQEENLQKPTGVVLPVVSFNLSKTASPNPVVTGGTVTYTITISNNSDLDLHNLVITETLPSHIISGLTPAGSLLLPGQPITWTIPILIKGATWTIPFTSMVELGYVGLITNTVQATAAEGSITTYTQITSVVPHRVYLPLILKNNPPVFPPRPSTPTPTDPPRVTQTPTDPPRATLTPTPLLTTTRAPIRIGTPPPWPSKQENVETNSNFAYHFGSPGQ